jgi:hypothetical protein
MKLPIAALVLCLLSAEISRADEWLAAPSTYTHDPRTAERVRQYTPIGPVYAYPDPTIQSGYRHVRSTIRAGDAADYLHVVEQWGDTPVRPYGEWLYPYRPYSVPYELWGPQYFLDPFGFGGPFPDANPPHQKPYPRFPGPRPQHPGPGMDMDYDP